MNGIYVVKNPELHKTSEFNPNTGTSFRKGAYDKMLYELPEFTLDKINKVYIGKPHHCMCGCAGEYYEAKDNSAKIQRILNKIRKNSLIGIEVIEDYIFTIILGTKQYTIYLLKG